MECGIPEMIRKSRKNIAVPLPFFILILYAYLNPEYLLYPSLFKVLYFSFLNFSFFI